MSLESLVDQLASLNSSALGFYSYLAVFLLDDLAGQSQQLIVVLAEGMVYKDETVFLQARVNDREDLSVLQHLDPGKIDNGHEVLFDVWKILAPEHLVHVFFSINWQLFRYLPKVTLLEDQVDQQGHLGLVECAPQYAVIVILVFHEFRLIYYDL